MEATFIFTSIILAIAGILIAASIFIASLVYVYRTVVEVQLLKKESKANMQWCIDVSISNSERIAKLERENKASQRDEKDSQS